MGLTVIAGVRTTNAASAANARITASYNGAGRRAPPRASAQLLAIAREAVWNAFVHAQPRHVTVTLAYSARGVDLTVADDGIEIPAAVQRGRPGHWGLPGLRERAAKIGPTLALATGDGAGTTWTLAWPRH